MRLSVLKGRGAGVPISRQQFDEGHGVHAPLVGGARTEVVQSLRPLSAMARAPRHCTLAIRAVGNPKEHVQAAPQAASPGPSGTLTEPLRAPLAASMLRTHLVLDREVNKVSVHQHLVGRPQLRVVAEEERGGHFLARGQP